MYLRLTCVRLALSPKEARLVRLAHLGLRFERVEKSVNSRGKQEVVGRLEVRRWGMFDYRERDSIVS